MKKTLVLTLVLAFVASFITFATAEEKKDGKTLFTDAKCMNCHGISALQITATNAKSKAPDLSTVGDHLKADFLAKYLVKEEKLNEKNHPVKYASAETLPTLVEWLMTLKTPAK